MATSQSNYLKYGIADGDSRLRVWDDTPNEADGMTAGEGGKGRSMEYGQQIGIAEETLLGAHGEGGPWGNVSTTVSAGYMGTSHTMLFIVNGVSYTVVPGTATEIPRILREIMDNARDPYGNGIPYS